MCAGFVTFDILGIDNNLNLIIPKGLAFYIQVKMVMV